MLSRPAQGAMPYLRRKALVQMRAELLLQALSPNSHREVGDVTRPPGPTERWNFSALHEAPSKLDDQEASPARPLQKSPVGSDCRSMC